jgi:hypothetical protein
LKDNSEKKSAAIEACWRLVVSFCKLLILKDHAFDEFYIEKAMKEG